MPPTPSPSALCALRRLAFPTMRTTAVIIRASPLQCPHRDLSTSSPSFTPNPPTIRNRNAPSPTASRGPKSEETTQTDFSAMDIFRTSSTPSPATSIDATTSQGFHLSNGVKTDDGSGVMLLGGECFLWRPWLASSTPASASASATSTSNTTDTATGAAPSKKHKEESVLLDNRGRLHLPTTSLRILATLHPRPDLLIIGTGATLHPLHPDTRAYLSQEIGVRVDVMDTANAAAAYNLLGTERGLDAGGVGAVMLRGGWKGA